MTRLLLAAVIIAFVAWVLFKGAQAAWAMFRESGAKWQPKWIHHGQEEVMYLTKVGKSSTRIGSVFVNDPEYDYKKAELESEAIQRCTSRNSSDKSLKKWGG